MPTFDLSCLNAFCASAVTSANVDELAGIFDSWYSTHKGEPLTVDLSGLKFSKAGIKAFFNKLVNAIDDLQKIVVPIEWIFVIGSDPHVNEIVHFCVALTEAVNITIRPHLLKFLPDGGVSDLRTPGKGATPKGVDDKSSVSTKDSKTPDLKAFASPNQTYYKDEDGNCYELDTSLDNDFQCSQPPIWNEGDY